MLARLAVEAEIVEAFTETRRGRHSETDRVLSRNRSSGGGNEVHLRCPRWPRTRRESLPLRFDKSP
jgi:hypothetical protein